MNNSSRSYSTKIQTRYHCFQLNTYHSLVAVDLKNGIILVMEADFISAETEFWMKAAPTPTPVYGDPHFKLRLQFHLSIFNILTIGFATDEPLGVFEAKIVLTTC